MKRGTAFAAASVWAHQRAPRRVLTGGPKRGNSFTRSYFRRVISVHILYLDDCFATTIMPQPTEITQFIFGQPLRRGFTSASNHSSSTWCRKTFERQGEITPPCGEPSVVRRKKPSSTAPAFSHLSIILRMTPSVNSLVKERSKVGV